MANFFDAPTPSDDKDDVLTIELTDYVCGDCGGMEWHLQIGHCSNGKTRLVIVCADEDCVEAKRKLLGADDDEPIIWQEFDITDQGHDEEEMESIDKVLLN